MAEQSNATNYVALDLGSETMAAYWQPWQGKGKMINLQAHANALVGGAANCHHDYGANAPSQRKSSRVSVRPNYPSEGLTEEHARIDLIEFRDRRFVRADSESRSIFSHFFPGGAPPLNERTIPNPKIAFQFNAASVFPESAIEGTGTPVMLEPATVIEHLTTQVVRNFVLRSPELVSVDPATVHLVLTVPNVYSVEHSESLRKFVLDNTGVGEVSIISESDALAYYHVNDPNVVQQLVKEERNQGKNAQTTRRVLTIDVGRGTTDLSLVEATPPAKADEEGKRQIQYAVLGRTGRSSGGNQLSYLFASYFNERLREAYKHLGGSLGIAAPPFDFVTVREDRPSVDQLEAVAALERLIELIKRHTQEDYRLCVSDEAKAEMDSLVGTITDRLLRPTKEQLVLAEKPLSEQGEVTLRAAIKMVLSPPNLITPPSGILKKIKRESAPVQTPRDKKLREEIEAYITRNVDELLDELGMMVAPEEVRRTQYGQSKRGARHELHDPRGLTTAVVGGQAAHYQPLRKRIRERCKALVGGKIHFLEGAEAKEACCQGAVRFLWTGFHMRNPHKLHGTYGFISNAPGLSPEKFKAIPDDKLNEGRPVKVEFENDEKRSLVYTPSILCEDELPLGHDGMASVLMRCRDTVREYTVQYVVDRATLVVNGDEVSPSTFGSVEEDIWPKVWPERLIRMGI